MIHLGQTRSVAQGNHALLTPDTFVRAPLPGMVRATAVVHTSFHSLPLSLDPQSQLTRFATSGLGRRAMHRQRG